MIRIIRLENQRRFIAQIALNNSDQRARAADGNHQFERLPVSVNLDAVILFNFFGDRFSQVSVAFRTAVMILAGGDNSMRFFGEHLKGEKPEVRDPAIAVQDNRGDYREEKAWPPSDAIETVFPLVGGTNLKAHMGHKVEVTGSMSKADMDQHAKMDTMAKDKAMASKAMTLNVTSVKMISANCP